MNQLGALRETIETWKLAAGVGWEEPIKCESLSLAHCVDMLARVEAAEIAAADDARGYVLGWVQAAAVANGVLTLENCKDIYRRWA